MTTYVSKQPGMPPDLNGHAEQLENKQIRGQVTACQQRRLRRSLR